MIVKAAQWGNSIGVRIPQALAKKSGITVDSAIEIDEADEGIIIKPLGKKEYSLKELVKGITAQNRHHEIDFGHPVGRELL
ncbi:MAG TPA: AbrB/MazE/SpoVT family DNA-binding domain-containing protein [Thermodesulfovibrionales bacterium]|jgi:antitoxin MazE|nr:AbrB/MazE/SpoVT family DNA-binding domain-containing protein [Thermodesulfovibrionales bacterium]